MKHSLQATAMLLMFFMVAQTVGLLIIHESIDVSASQESGETVFKDLPVGERPPLEEDNSYWTIFGAIILGTLLLLLLIKLNWVWVWKIWFIIAVMMALSISFGTFIRADVAVAIGLGLALWKVFRPNFWIQNLTEVFIYGGLAVIFVPVLNLWSVSILLVLIALYDAYAVWKSKHMITLAKSQTEAKVFAGLFIPYRMETGRKTGNGKASKTVSKIAPASKIAHLSTHGKSISKAALKNVRTAILGGGDIGFPLIFAGVVMKEMGLWQSIVIPFFALAGLGFLLWYGDEKKFYPAMPFIGAACFLGLGVVWLLGLL